MTEPHVKRAARGAIRAFLAAATMIGCAYPPSSFPVRSAASPEAAPAPAPVVARAMLEEPPLPGASTEGWTGLGPPPSADPHAGHHMHHHGHGAMVPATADPDAGVAPTEAPHHAH